MADTITRKVQGLVFEEDIDSSLTVNGNKTLLEEVLMNLLSNAAHAVRDNKDNPPRISLRIYRHSPEILRIEMKDNGYGIDKKIIEDIFANFMTTKASTEGTGLGLSRARYIVEMHGGKIWAQSQGQGMGAQFVVELPLGKVEGSVD